MTRSVLTGSQDTRPGVRQQTLAANREALGAQRRDPLRLLRVRDRPNQNSPEFTPTPPLWPPPHCQATLPPAQAVSTSGIQDLPRATVCHPAPLLQTELPLGLSTGRPSTSTSSMSHQPPRSRSHQFSEATACYLRCMGLGLKDLYRGIGSDRP